MDAPADGGAPSPPAPPRGHPLAAFLRGEQLRFLLLAGAVGVGAAVLGAAFQWGTRAGADLAFGAAGDARGDVLRAAAAAPVWRRLLAPAVGGLLVAALLAGLARLLRMGPAGGAGIADVMQMLARGDRVPTVRGALRGALGALVGIGSGASAGREGPMCQLATALAARLGQLMRLSRARFRTLVVAGVAAGLAAAYNAPLAATLFALEVLVAGDLRFLAPCAVASATAAATVHLLGQAEPLYVEGTSLRIAVWWEVPVLCVLAAAGGAVAAGFLRLLDATRAAVARLRLPLPVALCAGGCVVGALGCVLPQVYGNGYETARDLVAGGPRNVALPLVLAALAVCAGKVLATAASVGTGVPGGVFTPTLVVGGAVGAAVGQVVKACAPGVVVEPGLYAVVGMAALLAGTLHAPVLAVVMLAELTGNLGAALWLLVPVFLAVATSHLFVRDSLYVAELRRRGVPWAGDVEADALRNLRVRDVMRTNIPLLPADLPAVEVMRVAAETRRPYLFVGTRAGEFLGVIDLHDVKTLFATDPRDLDGLVVAQDLVEPIPVVYPDETLASVNEKLWFRDLGHLPVLESPARPRFLGIVTRRDLLGAIDHQILRRDEMLRHVGVGPGDGRYVELPPDLRLEEIPCPRILEGRTLAEVDVRAAFGVTVLAVIRAGADGRSERAIPDPAYRFRRGDSVVVLASDRDVSRLVSGAHN